MLCCGMRAELEILTYKMYMINSYDKFIAYYERFGELPNSRLMPDEVLERLDDMVETALDRGSPLTVEELQVGCVPPGVMI